MKEIREGAEKGDGMGERSKVKSEDKEGRWVEKAVEKSNVVIQGSGESW